MCIIIEKTFAGCRARSGGCRLQQFGSGSGSGIASSGRFGLGCSKKLAGRIRVQKIVPVQDSIIDEH